MTPLKILLIYTELHCCRSVKHDDRRWVSSDELWFSKLRSTWSHLWQVSILCSRCTKLQILI